MIPCCWNWEMVSWIASVGDRSKRSWFSKSVSSNVSCDILWFDILRLTVSLVLNVFECMRVCMYVCMYVGFEEELIMLFTSTAFIDNDAVADCLLLLLLLVCRARVASLLVGDLRRASEEEHFFKNI